MTADSYRLGIDFGTSTTVAVFAAGDRPARPLLFESSPLLSSAVAVAETGGALCLEGSLLTGGDAERAAVANPAGFEANPKRRIDDGVVWLGEREVAVPELIAAVFARVAAEAHRIAGDRPGEVVLTHPVVWGRARLDVLVDAAARAGLADVHLVAEPVAAAAYLAGVLGQQVHPGRCLIVYDLGAGTCQPRPAPGRQRRMSPHRFHRRRGGGRSGSAARRRSLLLRSRRWRVRPGPLGSTWLAPGPGSSR